MIFKYLNKDIKGAYSKKVYGKKNERVYVVKNEVDMLLVMSESGNKFYITQNDLSDGKV
jgi:hypothetical protein